MRRDDGYRRMEDEPTRPVEVPRLRPIVINESSAHRVVEADEEPPRREPTVKLAAASRG
jgi:hypothetical protein